MGADMFLGLSGPNLVRPEWVASMAKDAIVFALANPVPEIMPNQITGLARVVATGRSDFPNQINNVLCFPGLFRGVLDVRARHVNEEMKLAAAEAIAGAVGRAELGPEYVIPSVFHPTVHRNVARAVARAAVATGVGESERERQRHRVFL